MSAGSASCLKPSNCWRYRAAWLGNGTCMCPKMQDYGGCGEGDYLWVRWVHHSGEQSFYCVNIRTAVDPASSTGA